MQPYAYPGPLSTPLNFNIVPENTCHPNSSLPSIHLLCAFMRYVGFMKCTLPNYIPASMTHLLQPLDLCVFATFKTYLKSTRSSTPTFRTWLGRPATRVGVLTHICELSLVILLATGELLFHTCVTLTRGYQSPDQPEIRLFGCCGMTCPVMCTGLWADPTVPRLDNTGLLLARSQAAAHPVC